MNDTTEEAHKKQLEIIYAKTEEERFQLGIEFIDFGRSFMENAIINEQPNITRPELNVIFFSRCYASGFNDREKEIIIKGLLNYKDRQNNSSGI